MKKNLLLIILLLCLSMIFTACSNSEPEQTNSETSTKVESDTSAETEDETSSEISDDKTAANEIPAGTWVIRYVGNENGEYVEELNMTDDSYLGKISFIESNILNYGRVAHFTLDDDGKGTYTDEWDEVEQVTFDEHKITFEDGDEIPYVRDGDFLWFEDDNLLYYNVMENVSEELLEQIKNVAFGCVDLKKASVGDYVTLDTYDTYSYNEKTEPLKWRVIDTDGDNLLVLCDQLIDAFSYNTNPDMVNLNDITWENSSLRAFLNDPEGFLLMFTDEEIDRIQTTHLENKAANEELMKYWGGFEDDPSLNEIPNWSTMALQDLTDDPETDDKVFLLSFPEVEKYFGEATDSYTGESGYPYDSMPANPEWIAYITQAVEYDATTGFGMYDFENYSGAWMTRTLCTDHHDEKMVTHITANGQVFAYFTYTPMFIRPAMWISR